MTNPIIFISGFSSLRISCKVYSLVTWLCLLCVALNPFIVSSQSLVCPASGRASAFRLPSLLLQPGENTYNAHALHSRLRLEVAKRDKLSLDSMVKWGEELLSIYASERQESHMAEINMMLGQAHMEKTQTEVARQYYQAAIYHACNAGDNSQLANAYLKYGWSFIYGNQYDTAIWYTTKALSIAQEMRDTTLLIDVYKNLPRLHYIRKDLLNAYKTSTELIAISKAANHTYGFIYGNHLVSDLLGEMNLLEKQMDLVYACLTKTRESQDTSAMYILYNTVYQGYLNNKYYDSAIYYAKVLLPFGKALQLENLCIDKIAKAFVEGGIPDSARVYYEKSIAHNRKYGSYIDVYKFVDLGRIEFRKSNFKKALSYYQLAETNIERAGPETRKSIYKALYEYYDHFAQYKLANTNLKKYHALANDQAALTGMALLENEAELLASRNKLLAKENEMNAAIVYKQQQQNRIVYSATGIILFLIAVAFYRFKKHREMQNKEALNNERLRISRELHDEVGSTLSGIALYGHVAKDQMRCTDIPGASDSLTIMQSSATDMVKKLSDIVWLINPERDTIAELFDRLAQYARQMGAARRMMVRIDMTPQLAEMHIPLDARRNIYLFCKEAINNAVKYSNGSFIELRVYKISGNVKFSVRDDGNGFDEMTVRHGNGLRNMVKRAEAIGALCHINTKPNKGAHIEMQYKLIQ